MMLMLELFHNKVKIKMLTTNEILEVVFMLIAVIAAIVAISAGYKAFIQK